jgi:hypothetical protein
VNNNKDKLKYTDYYTNISHVKNIITRNNYEKNEFNVNSDDKNRKIFQDLKLVNKWVVNLSTVIFNEIEMSVLKLDPKIQISPKKIPIENIIENIESKLQYSNLKTTDLETIRNNLTNILQHAKKPVPNLTKEQI